MTRAGAGQLIRLLGLTVELLGLLGISVLLTRGGSALPKILGREPDTVFRGMVLAGFAAWLIGRILIVGTRPRRRDEDDRRSHDLRL